jgi:beta-lactam-binding protein with PASTA domain/serine/threonine protein kinase
MNPTALTEMVDRVFDDRYRIEELVGVGVISAVFSAFDHLEDRWVALKVFDAALADDDRFVERLLEAAEQASVLNHPNIVEIYDWGVHGGPYIVSELCEGGSLAALLEEGHRLAASQALVMTLECARAMNYGHEQGAIHRNLTPRNVLFTSDQQVRVSDYGLAKVLADSPVSQASRALENVRYASPEQARGRPVGESSDLYSLALVVSEAVSGIAPHVAETVVGTLMERAEAAANLDAALGDLLPPLERCGRVDPTQRPEADELTIALLAAAESMPRPQSMPLVGIGNGTSLAEASLLVAGGVIPISPVAAADESSDADDEVGEGAGPANRVEGAIQRGLVDGHTPASEHRVVSQDTPDEFDVAALDDVVDVTDFAGDEPGPDEPGPDEPGPDEPGANPVALPLGALENLEQADPVFAEIPGADIETELDVPEPASTGRSTRVAYEELEDDAEDRLPWWPLVALGILIAGVVAAGMYFLVLNDSAELAFAPDVIGMQYDDLGDRLGERDWDITRLEARVDGTVVGSVLSQEPSPGDEVDPALGLTVTVSLGNQMIEIPSDIIGLTVEQAESRLGTVGLVLGRLSQESSEGLAAGLVIGLDEPTAQMPTGEGVDLRISAGPDDRIVPGQVVGLTIGDATSLLVGLRLQAVEEPTFDPEAAVGTVLASIPPAGQVVPADSAVTLIVSAGAEPVEMPDIIGLQLDEAIDVIKALGLIFIDTTGTPGEEVIGSVPPIGAVVDVGTEVTIILNDPVDEDEAEDEG